MPYAETKSHERAAESRLSLLDSQPSTRQRLIMWWLSRLPIRRDLQKGSIPEYNAISVEPETHHGAATPLRAIFLTNCTGNYP